MGDYNDLRRSAATGVPEDKLYDSATQVARNQPEQLGSIHPVRAYQKGQAIYLHIGSGKFVFPAKYAEQVVIAVLAARIKGE